MGGVISITTNTFRDPSFYLSVVGMFKNLWSSPNVNDALQPAKSSGFSCVLYLRSRDVDVDSRKRSAQHLERARQDVPTRLALPR